MPYYSLELTLPLQMHRLASRIYSPGVLCRTKGMKDAFRGAFNVGPWPLVLELWHCLGSRYLAEAKTFSRPNTGHETPTLSPISPH